MTEIEITTTLASSAPPHDGLDVALRATRRRGRSGN